MRTIWLAILALPLGAQQAEVETLLRQSAEDWNRGDLVAFMSYYEESPETTFVGRSVLYGTRALLERYRKSYADREQMGKLHFTDTKVRPVAPDLAIATTYYNLERSAKGGGPAYGIVTLVVRKRGGAWRIIHDHSAQLGTRRE